MHKNIELLIPVIPLDESILDSDLRIIDHINLIGHSPKNIGFIALDKLYNKNLNTGELSIKVAAIRNGEFPTCNEIKILSKAGVKAISYHLLPKAFEYLARGYTITAKAYIPSIPSGFIMDGFCANIKENKKNDLAYIYSSQDLISSGVFTQNKVRAASINNNEERLSNNIQTNGVICNSGNANCITASDSISNDKILSNSLVQQLKAKQILTASTGVIGVDLPINKITTTIKSNINKENIDKLLTYLHSEITNDNDEILSMIDFWNPLVLEALKQKPKLIKTYAHINFILQFAEAIFTTDTKTKISKVGNILGISKGAAMVEPNMATMLGFICSNYKIEGISSAMEEQSFLKRTLKEATKISFNSISIDTDTSTNDMVLIFNNPNSTQFISQKDYKEQIKTICMDLAMQIVADGEGITKLIQCSLSGFSSITESPKTRKQIAKNIINSPLVKTACFGNDANWGRILMALGKNNELINNALDLNQLHIYLQDICVFSQGSAINYDSIELKHKLKLTKLVDIDVYYGSKEKSCDTVTVFGNDLSYEYIRLNAEYTT